jgi:hypothetical protein
MSDDPDPKAPPPEATPEAKPEAKGSRTQKDRADQKRQEKLDLIRDQLDSGQLTIRKMTPAERAKNPPKPRPPKRGRP